MKIQKWYELNDPDEVDSPALLIYKDRVASNIQTMINIAGDAKRLIPHVKTHKMAEIVKMQLDAGISQFKCATIAEAEMLADSGAKNILIAYQLNFSKAKRFLSLIKKYPQIEFSSLIDNIDSAEMLNDLFAKEKMTANVFIDVDTGMNRTGIEADDKMFYLFTELKKLPNINFRGLHIYDGHIRDEDFELRKQKVKEALEKVNAVKQPRLTASPSDRLIRAEVWQEIIGHSNLQDVKIIAGGTPTFTVHALNKDEYCSPGTCLLWDYGYDALLKEQPFEFAAALLTRVISKPLPGLITTDLGHKSVAAENPISKRIFFLNLEDYEIKSQSEEHLVVSVKDWDKIHVGDVLYGIPYHICPTVALYDEANIIENGNVVDNWNVIARKKKITI
ncbi:MAG TPA: D-TA family PLP-dependent enzyme [Hanamia sp.]|nr:D-TA family PLP-dependent enzyme [Hanamia sp.]